jgi:hypothetical protein
MQVGHVDVQIACMPLTSSSGPGVLVGGTRCADDGDASQGGAGLVGGDERRRQQGEIRSRPSGARDQVAQAWRGWQVDARCVIESRISRRSGSWG